VPPVALAPVNVIVGSTELVVEPTERFQPNLNRQTKIFAGVSVKVLPNF